MPRYKLYEEGPDDRSTYPGCFGRDAGPGKLIAEANRLADLVPAVDEMQTNASYHHTNWHIRDTHRREWIQPSQFWARKCVQAAKPKQEE